MTFDPKTLLKSPMPPAQPAPPKPMTIDDLAAKLAQISAIGMGGALVALPDGHPVMAVDLVAHGEVPAHFVLRGKRSTGPNELWSGLLGRGLIAFGSIEHAAFLILKKINPGLSLAKVDKMTLDTKITTALGVIAAAADPRMTALEAMLMRTKSLLPSRNHIAHSPLVVDVYFGSNGEVAAVQTMSSLKSDGAAMTYSEIDSAVHEAHEVALGLYNELSAIQ